MSLVSTRSWARWPPISDSARSILRWSCPGLGSAVEPTGSSDHRTTGITTARATRDRRRRMRSGMLGGAPVRACRDPCSEQGFREGLNVAKRPFAPARISHVMPRPTSFGRDPGLQLRMTLTMFLLGAVYVVLIAVLLQFASGIAVAVIAGGLALLNIFASDKLALAAMGGRVVSPQEAPQLHAMIERLCVQADLPKPKVAVANTAMPNAFALGRSPKNATVCATTGIMDLLSPAELEGVMAHELTHVANRDVMVMTLAAFFATIAAYIVQFGFFFGGGASSDDDDGPSFIVLFLVSLAVYVVSFILMQALSRYREFAADRGSALITGRPSALASALQKISSGMHRIPQKDLRAAGEMSAFFIFPPGAGKALGNVFSTHPPMEKRIERLMRLESQLQGVAA